MRDRDRKLSRFLSPLATLAAAVTPFRPGSTAPAGALPLAGAPAPSAREARSISRSRLRRSLRASTAEGLFAEVVSACAGGAVITGWALYLGASPFVTGILVALPQMAQLFQVPAAWSTALLGHRRACLWLVGLSRQALLPLALLPFLPFSPPMRQGILITLAALAAVLGVLGNNAWVAWMAHLVPRRVRGRYFGRRTALCMLGASLAAGGAGLLLDAGRGAGSMGVALAVLQILACASGVVTTLLMLRQHDPRPDAHRAPVRLADALLPFRDPTARGLLAYQVFWNVAVGTAGSFFSLFMIQALGVGFSLVALHGAALAAVRMLVAPLWGTIIDRVGARPVLIACSFGCGLVPFIWLLPTRDALWPLAVDAVVAGVLWCGHSLAAFTLALSPSRERPFYIAAFAAAGGLAFSAGTALGGSLVEALPARLFLGGHVLVDLQVLFVLSGCLRLAAAVVGLRIADPARRVTAIPLAAPAPPAPVQAVQQVETPAAMVPPRTAAPPTTRTDQP